MYYPEIGALYKSKEGERYYKIVSFENPSMDGIKIGFQVPGETGATWEHKGLDKVSDFLHSIERVSLVSSELESLAESERKLNQQIFEVQSKRKFLQRHSQTRPTCTPQHSMGPSDDEAHYQEGQERGLNPRHF